MTKRRMILMSGLGCLIVFLAIQAISQGRDSNTERQRKMSEAQKKKDAEQKLKEFTKKSKESAKQAEQRQKEFNQKRKELAKEGRPSTPSARKKWIKEVQEKHTRIIKELLREKAAIGATEEQWELIKPKLEKVRMLRGPAKRSFVGMSLAGGSSNDKQSPKGRAKPSGPIWQWHDYWDDKSPGELTESQKCVKRLIALVERQNATPQQLRRAMDALREARREEAQIEKQLADTREELREILTTRQEAALALMNSF